ncbi:MAG: NADPH-dependent assimilatory sulfite reductase hemoprotein subunit [Proteobacteria bacterium]|nr:NADPH-dependent assimilatory sulfite reductase hemoprotein subunit [Pseudomonadota bacterium]
MLADELASDSRASRGIVRALAEDDIDVAWPILLRSKSLEDTDLIEIAIKGSIRHRLAIAQRELVEEVVSAAVMAFGEPEVAKSLLANSGARISERTFVRITELAKEWGDMQPPLAARPDLPATIALEMLEWAIDGVHERLYAAIGGDKAKLRRIVLSALDGEKIAGAPQPDEVVEPIYGRTYLPRKFKVAVAVPPSNDVDLYANDLGFIAVVDQAGEVVGWNVVAGGGMGMTHGEPDTYPRTADMLGFCATDQAVAVAEAVVTTQRDWGDRANRKHARLKYTIEDRGLDNFRAEVARRAGITFGEPKPFVFTAMGDRYGWVESGDGRAHLTLYVQNGRVQDGGVGHDQMSALRQIAELGVGDFRITPNQNLIIANIPLAHQDAVNRIAKAAGLLAPWSGLRRNAMACVALPTCGLALAESERYLPTLLDALDDSLARHGLSADDIVIRMTGCPNGCARPYLAEIGLVGKGPGRYNLYLGAAFDGSRLSKLYAEDLDHEGVVAALDPVFAAYATDRQAGERFGDFTIRAGFVARTSNGRDFHANVRGRVS